MGKPYGHIYHFARSGVSKELMGFAKRMFNRNNVEIAPKACELHADPAGATKQKRFEPAGYKVMDELDPYKVDNPFGCRSSCAWREGFRAAEQYHLKKERDI